MYHDPTWEDGSASGTDTDGADQASTLPPHMMVDASMRDESFGYPMKQASHASDYTDASATDLSRHPSLAYPIMQSTHPRESLSPRPVSVSDSSPPGVVGVSPHSDSDLTHGRTSIQANKLLVEMFEEFSDNYHHSHPFRTSNIFWRSLLVNFNSLAFLLLLGAMWTSYGVLKRTHILVECCILTLNWLLNASLETYLQYLSHTEMLRLLRARMELVLDLPPLAETRTTEMPPSSTFVRTLRDGLWRPLPMNLLVSGDVIELDAEDRIPCPCKRITLNQPSAPSAAAGPATTNLNPNGPVTLAQASWSSQTQLLQHQHSLSNLVNHPTDTPSHPYNNMGDIPAGTHTEYEPTHMHPYREQSLLSSIRSDSAAEAADDDMVRMSRLPSDAHPSIELAPLRAPLDPLLYGGSSHTLEPFHTTASVASSYSATPSPMSSTRHHTSGSGSSHIDTPHAQIAADTTAQPATTIAMPPPPPPPSPPEVAPPPTTGPASVDSSQTGAPTVIVHIADSPPAPTPAPAVGVGASSVGHVRFSADLMSPASSLSSIDAETKEQIRQTDTTFIPPNVIMQLQQQQQRRGPQSQQTTTNDDGTVPIKTYSMESTGSSSASTLVDDDVGVHRWGGVGVSAASFSVPHSSGSFPPPAIPGLPFSPLTDEGPRHYIVDESPLKPQLEFILRPRNQNTDSGRLKAAVPPTNTFLAQLNYVTSKQKYLVIGAMLLYWLFVFLRLGRRSGEGFKEDRDPEGEHTYEYIYWVLYCSALLALPILNISQTFWLFLLDTLGNSILLVTQEEMQNVYDDEINGVANPVPKKTTASLFSSASRKRAMKKRMVEAAKAKARAAQNKKNRRGASNLQGMPTAHGLDEDDDASSVSSVSSVSSLSSEDTASSVSSRDSDDDEIDEDAHTYSIVDGLELPFSAIMRHTWDIMTGNEFYITRTVNPLQVLGGVTVFCCLDNEGILSENEPSADHMCFLKQPEPTPIAGAPTRPNPSQRSHHHHHRHAPQPKVIVLDLMNDPDRDTGIVIEGDEWHDQHLNSLKPLGLNAILNNACNLPHHMLSQYEFSSTEPTTVTTTSSSNTGGGTSTTTNSQEASSSSSDSDSNSGLGCLCSLGKEIGFDVNFIKQQYYIGKVIYTVAVQNTTTKIRPKRKHRLLASGKTLSKASSTGANPSAPSSTATHGLSPDLQILSKIHTMTSMSVQDRFMPSSLHLMTNGDPFLVLFHSTHFWNGHSIQPLSDHIRTQILGIYQQWNHQDLKCLAYSYSPIFPPSIYNYVAMFNPEEKVQYVIENLNEEYDARRRQKAARGPSMSSASSSSSLSGMSDAGAADHPDATLVQPAEPMPTRRGRFATEHSTIAEQDEDEHGHANPAVGHTRHDNELHQQHDHGDDDMALHDDHGDHHHHHHHHDEYENDPVDGGDHFIEHSHQDDVAHHDAMLDHDQQANSTNMHRHTSDADMLEAEPDHAVEYSHSYSNHSGRSNSSYAPLGTMGSMTHAGGPRLISAATMHSPYSPPLHQHAMSPNTRNSAQSYTASLSPRNANEQVYMQPPPPPPSPPMLPMPTDLDTSLPSLHDESTSTIHPTDLPTNLDIAPLSLNTSPHDVSFASSMDDGSSHYRLEAFTPKPRKPLVSHSMTKSQSFPSGFQPHLSLGSILPSEASLLQATIPSSSGTQPSNQTNANMDGRTDETTASTTTAGGHKSTNAASSEPYVPAQPMPTERDLLKQLQSSQIFLGMIAMRDQPKIEVRALVEDMKNAGIRFVFFSPDNERKTQAFGGKIGLNTDFNFYVSLRDPEVGEDGNESAPRRSQGKSQLPCGVSAIRNHLQTVDNVPLLVSLFTDCEPSSCCDMIRIYQENGESVMCMGSSLNVENTQAFMQADISASLDPMPAKACPYRTYNKPSNKRGEPKNQPGAPYSTYQQILQQYHNHNANNVAGEVSDGVTYSEAREFAASSAITSMPCSLLLSATTDLHHFMGLICEGRRLLHCMVQSLCFAMAAYITLFLVLLLDFIVDAPPVLNGYQILWLIWVIIPLLSISLLHTPRELDLMRNLPQKNSVKEEGLLTIGGVGMLEEGGGVGAISQPVIEIDDNDDEPNEHDEDGNEKPPRRTNKLQPRLPRRNPNPPGILTDTGRYLCYFLARFSVSAVVYLVFFLWMLHESFDSESTATMNHNFYWSVNSDHALFNNSAWQSLVLTVQNYSLVVFVIILVVHSSGFVYRYDSILHTNPAGNTVWIIAAIGVIVLQVLFCLVSVYSVSVPAVNLTDFRWYIFFGWPLVILILDELCKAHDRRHRDFNHKKARQHFDTVLGMHSPK